MIAFKKETKIKKKKRLKVQEMQLSIDVLRTKLSQSSSFQQHLLCLSLRVKSVWLG